MKSSITSSFAVAAALMAAGCSQPPSPETSEAPESTQSPETPQTYQPRAGDVPLTVGEAALARSVFGSDFDTSTIYKRRLRGTDAGCAIVHDAHTINLWDTGLDIKDYSEDRELPMCGSPTTRYLFMHEMTHIYQNRYGTEGSRCSIYNYELTGRSRFDEFCREQQGQIVADYVTRFLHSGDAVPYVISIRDFYDGTMREARDSLGNVLGTCYDRCALPGERAPTTPRGGVRIANIDNGFRRAFDSAGRELGTCAGQCSLPGEAAITPATSLSADDLNLRRIVEEKFPEARQSRLNVELNSAPRAVRVEYDNGRSGSGVFFPG